MQAAKAREDAAAERERAAAAVVAEEGKAAKLQAEASASASEAKAAMEEAGRERRAGEALRKVGGGAMWCHYVASCACMDGIGMTAILCEAQPFVGPMPGKR